MPPRPRQLRMRASSVDTCSLTCLSLATHLYQSHPTFGLLAVVCSPTDIQCGKRQKCCIVHFVRVEALEPCAVAWRGAL